MKYAIIFLITIIILFILLCTYLRKISLKNYFEMPNNQKINKSLLSKENDFSNPNPTFLVELSDFKKAQLGIQNSTKNEALYFKKLSNRKIKVFTINKKYIGLILIKNYKNFPLIEKKPEFFEGTIYNFITIPPLTKKVIISVQVKEECSKQVYHINKNYLNTLITLEAIFSKDQIIETNYGPSKIIEIFADHLIVDVPSLGKREIYDISETIK